MKKELIFSSALIIALLAIPYLTAEAETNTEPLSEKSQIILDRFEKTGTQVNCLNVRSIRTIKPLSDDLFLVRAGHSKYYLTSSKSKCHDATHPTTALTYGVSGPTRLCQGEILTVVSNRSRAAGIATGSCSINNFQELRQIETSD